MGRGSAGYLPCAYPCPLRTTAAHTSQKLETTPAAADIYRGT